MLEERLTPYIRFHSRFASDRSSLLDQVARLCLEKGLPLMPAEGAKLLYTITAIASPHRIVEVGAGFGYSTLLLALASPQARVISFEQDSNCYEVAHSLIFSQTIGERIELVNADAKKGLPRLNGSFHLVFLDAAKDEYLTYLKALRPRLTVGAVIIADDIYFMGEAPGLNVSPPARIKITQELAAFRHYIQKQDWLNTTFLPLGSGVSVSLVTKSPEGGD